MPLPHCCSHLKRREVQQRCIPLLSYAVLYRENIVPPWRLSSRSTACETTSPCAHWIRVMLQRSKHSCRMRVPAVQLLCTSIPNHRFKSSRYRLTNTLMIRNDFIPLIRCEIGQRPCCPNLANSSLTSVRSGSLLVIQVLQSYEEMPGNHYESG